MTNRVHVLRLGRQDSHLQKEDGLLSPCRADLLIARRCDAEKIGKATISFGTNGIVMS